MSNSMGSEGIND